MKTVLEKKITSTKVYQVRTLPIRKGSDYKYRLFVDGHAKTLYKNLAEAEKHIEVLTQLEIKLTQLEIKLNQLQTEKET